MRRVKKVIASAIALTVFCCTCMILNVPSLVENSLSLDIYLSSKIFPVLQEEATKYLTYPEDGERLGSVERYRNFQDILSCMLAKETWGDVTINQRLKIRRRPRQRARRVKLLDSNHQAVFSTPTCSLPAMDMKGNLIGESLRIENLCPLLSNRKILFVGPETTYHLHTNLLQAFERYENRSHSCYGTEFCTFHQICRGPRPIDEPFFPTGGFKKYPGNRELVATKSAILKYILSSSLYTGSNTQDARYTDPVAQVDRDTGVRQKDRYWLGQARKADIIILNRGPLPAPAWTYDGTRRGNWTSAPGLRAVKSRTPSEMILNAALRVTVDRFLPEIVETMRILSSDKVTKASVLWHESWYIEPACVDPNHGTKDVLDASLDPWTLFYNAQGESNQRQCFL
ncbi:hypothetical protein GYMLUDRAFT_80362 [Collybiopsis luxurians FD-317 M1]|nr:hypothetical protein GYMLUDRAFT_80362 [Collybiopsis luxurians FD-317 M1]